MARAFSLVPLVAIFACSGPPPDSNLASLDLEYLGEFGSPSDPVGPEPLVAAVARDPDKGHVYANASSPGAEVIVYEENGEYRGVIGRAGEGPGELFFVSYIAFAGDTLHVFSEGPRHTRFDSNGEVLSVNSIPVRPRRVFFSPDGSLVVHGALNTPAGFAFPVHHILADGAVHSFGRSDTKSYTGEPEQVLVAMQTSDSIWIATPLEYQIELWVPGNEVARTIHRQPSWFQWPQKTNQSMLSDIWIDTTRLELWVAGGHLRKSTSERPVFTSIIEVIDLKSGEVIARDSIPGAALRFSSSGDLFRIEEGELGNNVLSMWRARVSRNVSQTGGRQ